jgi:hypothetical protein
MNDNKNDDKPKTGLGRTRHFHLGKVLHEMRERGLPPPAPLPDACYLLAYRERTPDEMQALKRLAGEIKEAVSKVYIDNKYVDVDVSKWFFKGDTNMSKNEDDKEQSGTECLPDYAETDMKYVRDFAKISRVGAELLLNDSIVSAMEIRVFVEMALQECEHCGGAHWVGDVPCERCNLGGLLSKRVIEIARHANEVMQEAKARGVVVDRRYLETLGVDTSGMVLPDDHEIPARLWDEPEVVRFRHYASRRHAQDVARPPSDVERLNEMIDQSPTGRLKGVAQRVWEKGGHVPLDAWPLEIQGIPRAGLQFRVPTNEAELREIIERVPGEGYRRFCTLVRSVLVGTPIAEMCVEHLLREERYEIAAWAARMYAARMLPGSERFPVAPKSLSKILLCDGCAVSTPYGRGVIVPHVRGLPVGKLGVVCSEMVAVRLSDGGVAILCADSVRPIPDGRIGMIECAQCSGAGCSACSQVGEILLTTTGMPDVDE